MGGGVMIKPVLDACHTASVAAINFYSGCTVLGMSCWSVGKAAWRRDNLLDFRVSVPLAAGAALGGLLGKEIYCQLASLYTDAEDRRRTGTVPFFSNLGDSALHHHKGPLSRKTGPALVPLRCRWIGLGNSGFIFGDWRRSVQYGCFVLLFFHVHKDSRSEQPICYFNQSRSGDAQNNSSRGCPGHLNPHSGWDDSVRGCRQRSGR